MLGGHCLPSVALSFFHSLSLSLYLYSRRVGSMGACGGGLDFPYFVQKKEDERGPSLLMKGVVNFLSLSFGIYIFHLLT